MIICLSCHTEFSRVSKPESDYQCPACMYRPPLIDGFFSWAPGLATQNENFPAESFEKLFELEARSFWFRSRNRLIIWAMNNYCPNFNSLLEIGCGTGFVLSAIKKEFLNSRISGSEIHSNGLAYAAIRLPDVELMQLDAQKLPFVNEYDVIGAFDVIEHIKDDQLVLCNIYNGLKPNGVCFITVPQHMWLWSDVDRDSLHQRRYSSAELHDKLERAGLQVMKSTSFVSLLVPLMLMARKSKRNKAGQTSPTVGLNLHPLVDKLMQGIMNIELMLIKLGISLPIGGSRLIIAKKMGL
jgi:ubiquinone/menaquinone biosynthesis C-methylase UbiE